MPSPPNRKKLQKKLPKNKRTRVSNIMKSHDNSFATFQDMPHKIRGGSRVRLVRRMTKSRFLKKWDTFYEI